MDQWNRKENPVINPHIYSHPILSKAAKTYTEEKTDYSTNDGRKPGYPHIED
jgi:hypothetical protein